MNVVRAYTRAKALVEMRFRFIVHVAVYVPVVVLMLFVDRFLTPPGQPSGWAWIAAWAWGIGVATHGLGVTLLADTASKTPLQALLRDRRSSFLLHLFAYLNTVLLLAVVNYTESPLPRPDRLIDVLLYWWFIWPTLFWGIGVFYHWFFSYLLRGWRVKKLKQRWTLKVMREIDGVDRPEKLAGIDVRAELRK